MKDSFIYHAYKNAAFVAERVCRTSRRIIKNLECQAYTATFENREQFSGQKPSKSTSMPAFRTCLILLFFLSSSWAKAQVVVTVNTTAISPATPGARQYVTSGKVMSMINYNGSFGDTISVRVYGKIERISQPSFTITTKTSNLNILLNKLFPKNLSTTEISAAFGNFFPNNLNISGPGASGIDLNNIVLPDGIYQVCFSVLYFSSNCPAGCPISNAGCSPNFTVDCRPVNGALITTNVRTPANPFIAQAISTGAVNAAVQFPAGCSQQTPVRIFGKIERISPAPFTISVDTTKLQPQNPVLLNTGTTQLTANQQLDAFNGFNPANLIISGIDPATIRDAGNNIKLPDGNYRICYYAKYVNSNGNLGGNASNPNLGCGNFNVCRSASAPQFIQPVNNLSLNSLISMIRPSSPVTFTWTPPQSTCGLPQGGYQYDFEIREILPNQGVVDAINNPYLFRKISLPTTTFLLDTNLYKNVLQQGKKYIIRVRATGINASSPIDIDNNGFSRVEAFQYGENADITIATPKGPVDPLLSYLSFDERKTDFWDDQFTVYQNKGRADTLVPIEEYIAYSLMQNGTAYGLNAIELFYLLNPDLINEKEVRLSHKAKLPVFPQIPASDQRKFNSEHANNLLTDNKEGNKFKNYLDSLRSMSSSGPIPANASADIISLINQLSNFGKEINTADRVSVSTINALLSELIFDLKAYAKNPKTNDLNHLQNVVKDLQEMTAPIPDNSASIPVPKTSLPYYAATNAVYRYDENPVQLSFSKNITANSYGEYFFTAMDRILPFDVIVYHSKTPPGGPVLNAPDLTATYRILYTLSSLYNNKNPEVNALSAPDLASTSQVSLPQTLGYKFWTLNMLNHKRTSAVTVDVKDVFQNSRKRWPSPKKLSIVLKVD